MRGKVRWGVEVSPGELDREKKLWIGWFVPFRRLRLIRRVGEVLR